MLDNKIFLYKFLALEVFEHHRGIHELKTPVHKLILSTLVDIELTTLITSCVIWDFINIPINCLLDCILGRLEK